MTSCAKCAACLSVLVFMVLIINTNAGPVNTEDSTTTKTQTHSGAGKGSTVDALILKSVEYEIGILEDDGSDGNSTETPELVTDKWNETEITFFLPNESQTDSLNKTDTSES